MILIIIGLTMLLLLVANGDAENSLRIVGGVDLHEDDYPFIVRMEVLLKNNKTRSNHHLCTCSALTPIWTLTAAHCIDGLKKSYSLINSGQTVKGVIRYANNFSDITFTLSHPSYKAYRRNRDKLTFRTNDIGLVRTDHIAIQRYGKINSVDHSTLIGFKAIVTGYGLTNQSKDNETLTLEPSKQLQGLDVVIIKCKKEYRRAVYPSTCVARLCSQWGTICPGDSGGPLIHRGNVVGVNSLGVRCTELNVVDRRITNWNTVGVMTPVSPFIDWIINSITHVK